MARHRPGTSRQSEDVGTGLSAVFGPDQPWVAVYGSGPRLVAAPADQSPAVTAEYLADGLHRLTCPGCAACEAG